MSDLHTALIITVDGYYDDDNPQVLKSIGFDATITASGVEYTYLLDDIEDLIQEVITEVTPD